MKTDNVLKAELIKEDREISLVKDKYSKLQNLQTDLKELDDKILDQIVLNEIEIREIYSDDLITLTGLFNEKCKISDVFEIEARSEDGNKMKSY